MLVTDAGMTTLVNELQSMKAARLLLVTDVGMATLGTPPLVTPHSRHESCPSNLVV